MFGPPSSKLLAFLLTVAGATAFRPSCPTRPRRSPVTLSSSVGGPADGRPDGDGDDDDDLDRFLAPQEESDSLLRAREYISDTNLPLSYSADQDDHNRSDDEEDDDDDDDDYLDESNLRYPTSATDNGQGRQPDGSLVYNGSASNNAASNSALFGRSEIPNDVLAKNPYMQVVSKLTPSELISRFTATSHPRVQEAVRTTILGLIGSLPKMAFDTTTITTGQRLASLMFQLQMTGYMFKNAEYRLSLSQSLGMYRSDASSKYLLNAGVDELVDDDDEDPLLSGKVKGKLKVRYAANPIDSANTDANANVNATGTDSNDENTSGDAVELEVDAAAYMSELRAEVSRLKDELSTTRKEKEDALRKDLLLYIRTLPKKELQSLTNTMSQDVLVSMKGLVQVVLKGIGDGKLGPNTVTKQSGEAMAQLCMWQLVLGYNLRELEVREQMKKSLTGVLTESNVDVNEPGTLE